MSERDSKCTRAILLIFLLALAARVGMALWLPQHVIWPDGARYEDVALNLLEGKGFGDLPDNYRSVPTQPLLIAAVYTIFGKSYLALRVVSAVIGSLTCVMGFLLARTLFGTKTAVFAGVLLALYPHLVYLSALFEYPQTLAILLVGVFLILHLGYEANPRRATLFGASLALGVLILTLPSLLAFAPVFLVLLIRRGGLAQSASRVAIALAGLTLTIGPWAYRNYVAYGQVVLVNAASGVNFWVANNETYARHGKAGVVPACAPGYENTTYCHEHRAMIAQLHHSTLSRTEAVFEQDRLAWERGLRFVRDSPLEFGVLTLRKFAQLWSPWPDATHMGPAHGGRWRNVISAATYIPILVLACAGLARCARTHGRRLLPVYSFMITFIAPLAVYLPTMRYRLPIDFLLAVFAAVPLASWWRQFAQWRASSEGLRPARAGTA